MKIRQAVVAAVGFILISAFVVPQAFAQDDGGTVFLPLILTNEHDARSPINPEPDNTGTPAPDLFVKADNWLEDMEADEINALNDYIASTGAERFNVLQADSSLFKTAQQLDLNVFDDASITVNRTDFDSGEVRYDVWAGQGESRTDSSIFIIEGDGIFGSVRAKDKEYQIDTLGDYQVIVELDTSAFYPDEDSDFEAEMAHNTDSDNGLVEEAENSSELSQISLLVAYTEAARDSQIDIQKWIELRVQETNLSFKNSGVKARVVLADSYVTPYTEVTNGDKKMKQDLERFASTDDNHAEEVHQKRRKSGADIVILLAKSSLYGNSCGRAQAIMAEPTTAFAIVRVNSALCSKYTFAHEIGHLLGARHNPEADSSTEPFAYGHGFQQTSIKNWWRTVMAYDRGCSCPRLLFWSSPDVDFLTIATGTAETHDNARVLNETRNEVANFYQKPVSIETVSINGPNEGNIGRDYLFTALVGSANATQPWSIRWEPEPSSGQGQEKATYQWSSAGIQTVKVTVENDAGAVQHVHNVNISVPAIAPSSLLVNGPSSGETDTEYQFSVNVRPTNVTTPLKYSWDPEPFRRKSDSVVVYRWSSTGTMTVKVTVSNEAGSITESKTVRIDNSSVSVSSVSVNGVLIANMNQTYEFTAAALPSNATGPIEYRWEPEPLSGYQGKRVAKFVWHDDGIKTVRVTASNNSGTAQAWQRVIVVKPKRRATVTYTKIKIIDDTDPDEPEMRFEFDLYGNDGQRERLYYPSQNSFIGLDEGSTYPVNRSISIQLDEGGTLHIESDGFEKDGGLTGGNDKMGKASRSWTFRDFEWGAKVRFCRYTSLIGLPTIDVPVAYNSTVCPSIGNYNPGELSSIKNSPELVMCGKDDGHYCLYFTVRVE